MMYEGSKDEKLFHHKVHEGHKVGKSKNNSSLSVLSELSGEQSSSASASPTLAGDQTFFLGELGAFARENDLCPM